MKNPFRIALYRVYFHSFLFFWPQVLKRWISFQSQQFKIGYAGILLEPTRTKRPIFPDSIENAC